MIVLRQHLRVTWLSVTGIDPAKADRSSLSDTLR